MDLYSSQPGSVTGIALPEDAAGGVLMNVSLGGWKGYVPFKSILTGFSIHPADGVCFRHSLRDFIYTYIFGARITPVTFSGISFAHVCERTDEYDTHGDDLFIPNYHGLEYVLSYYNANRISALGAPLTIVLGLATVIFGFLVELEITATNPEQQTTAFNLTFQGVLQATPIGLAPIAAAGIPLAGDAGDAAPPGGAVA